MRGGRALPVFVGVALLSEGRAAAQVLVVGMLCSSVCRRPAQRNRDKINIENSFICGWQDSVADSADTEHEAERLQATKVSANLDAAVNQAAKAARNIAQYHKPKLSTELQGEEGAPDQGVRVP